MEIFRSCLTRPREQLDHQGAEVDRDVDTIIQRAARRPEFLSGANCCCAYRCSSEPSPDAFRTTTLLGSGVTESSLDVSCSAFVAVNRWLRAGWSWQPSYGLVF